MSGAFAPSSWGEVSGTVRIRRVQHHALTSPSTLAPSRCERVAWPTVPADGSPHLHSVPSDVGLAPGLRPARLDIVTRVCRGGNRRAPVLRGSGRRHRARPDPGGPALSAVACAVEPPMGERPGTQAAARYRLTSPWRISSAYHSAAGPQGPLDEALRVQDAGAQGQSAAPWRVHPRVHHDP